MEFGLAFFVIVALIGVAAWIHHRSLKGVVSDVTDIKNDLVKVKAAVAPPPAVSPTVAPVVPPKV